MTLERYISERYRLYKVPPPGKITAQKLIPGSPVVFPFEKEEPERPEWEAPQYIPRIPTTG